MLNTLKFIAFLVLFLCSEIVSAQYVVQGKFLDQDQSPIPFASVLLMNQADSTMAKGQVSDVEGSFKIDVNESGNYFVSISAIGYEKSESEIFSLNGSHTNHNLGEITTAEETSQLDEIVIKAERPFFEQQIDRTVINVKSNISVAGGTALDVLQRSPGVVVDRMNSRISLSGKQGVLVMINGKLSRMPMEALVQLLAGTNAEKLDKIELITTPPSKYDAEGDAGMINIVMSKSEDKGTNGSVSVFSGYGRRAKYGTSINMNHRTKSFNLFGDYSFRDDNTRQFWDSDRVVVVGTEPIQTVVKNTRDALTRVHDAKLGFDWELGKKTTLGGQFTYFDRKWDMDAIADINVSGVTSSSYYLNMNTLEKNDWTFIVGNLNLTHQFSEYSSISFDVDNLDYKSNNPTEYIQDYYNDQNLFTNRNQLRSIKETPINTWVGKIDFSSRMNDKMSFEMGAKGSFSKLDNEIIVDNNTGNTWVPDTSLTSNAKMIENILAGYFSTRIHATPKLDVQLGVRYEHTVTNLDTREQADLVDRNYGTWFPSVFFNRKINDNNSWVLSYSRRITRPSFLSIAPFVIFNDPNSFFSGNVSLLPSFTDAFKAEYRYKSTLFSLQYSYDKNSITLFQPKINSDNKVVSTSQNLDFMKNYAATISFPYQLFDWWEMQFNIIGSYFTVQSSFYPEPVELSTGNINLNGFQKFKLKKGITFELSGMWQSKQLWGVSVMKPLGAINLGIEKQFSNSKLRLSYSDMFRMSLWKFATEIPEENLNTYEAIDFEQRQIRINYTWNFGNNKLKSKRKSGTGSEEEQRRFQN